MNECLIITPRYTHSLSQTHFFISFRQQSSAPIFLPSPVLHPLLVEIFNYKVQITCLVVM